MRTIICIRTLCNIDSSKNIHGVYQDSIINEKLQTSNRL